MIIICGWMFGSCYDLDLKARQLLLNSSSPRQNLNLTRMKNVSLSRNLNHFFLSGNFAC